MATQLLYDVPETLGALRVGRSTFYKLVSDGEIDVVKIGRKTLVPVESIERYVGRLCNGAAVDDRTPAA